MTVWEITSGIRRAKGCAVPQAGCRKTIVRKNSSADHLEWARPATWFLVPLHAQPTAGPAYRRDALCWAWCWTRTITRSSWRPGTSQKAPRHDARRAQRSVHLSAVLRCSESVVVWKGMPVAVPSRGGERSIPIKGLPVTAQARKEPKSCASANFATSADVLTNYSERCTRAGVSVPALASVPPLRGCPREWPLYTSPRNFGR